METLFITAADKDVASYKIYNNGSDEVAYADKEKTIKVTTSELIHMFNVGVMVIIDDTYYKPVSMKIESDVASLTIVKNSEATTTAATIKSVADPKA